MRLQDVLVLYSCLCRSPCLGFISDNLQLILRILGLSKVLSVCLIGPLIYLGTQHLVASYFVKRADC